MPLSPPSDDRLPALTRTGLTAAPDPAFDRFAELVRRVLNVPVALVTIVEADRQVFPGACGLAAPWQQDRETPLSHSFCKFVVETAAPLIVTDARTDPRVAGNPAITDLGVVGYAGMPLTDDTGKVLGSLCAIDTAPRRWTDSDLAILADLAAACSDSLRFRIATQTARRRQIRVGAAFDRSQLLLRASVALADTSTPDDVVSVVRELVTGSLDPAYVGISLIDRAGRVALRSGGTLPPRVAERWTRYPASVATPSSLAVRRGVPVLLPDLAVVRAEAPDAFGTFADMGWQSAASVPLPGPAGPIGALTFVWKQPYDLGDPEQTLLSALAGYVSQALQRAEYLHAQKSAAEILQRALLSALPETAPFEVAARYEPAARGEHVGGDWYDAVRLDSSHLALVIGDVTGHDMQAAALMGRLRSKLRVLLVDRHEPPAALLRRLDAANQALGDRIAATVVLAYLQPEPGAAGHQLHWSNAGHPSPLLLAGGEVTVLDNRDPLLGVLRRTPRTSHYQHVPPGSTVLFYTDGLIETRADAWDDRVQDLCDLAAGLADLPLTDLLDRLYLELAGDNHEDDVALLAVRTPY
ncbi:SpoIIE family protein phosphatase [Actinoplanes sp. NPDC026619]|uniref:SpoIIE family protein phosphatase n=1 Tax=Actinoplanes sp. NPDC026619 TaxID=3155798 RepID=UPI0033D2CE22